MVEIAHVGSKVIGTQTLGLRGLVLWLKLNEGSGSTAYDSSFYNNHGSLWQYRRSITIDNTANSNDLTDYQVLIELDSSNFDFSKAKNDGGDIRFYDENGNKLNYWIEEWDSTNEKAKIWVKVPSIPASSTKTIYMYYGNPSASSESNGEAVFEFFDDFESGTIDTNKWTQDGTAGNMEIYSVSKFGNYSAGKETTASNVAGDDFEIVHSLNIYDCRLVGYLKVNETSSGDAIRIMDDTEDNIALIGTSAANADYFIKYYEDAGTGTTESLSTPRDTNWHRMEITKYGTLVKWKIDNTDEGSYTFSSNFQVSKISYAVANPNSNCYVYLDLIFLTKYTDPEPTTSVGTEEVVWVDGRFGKALRYIGSYTYCGHNPNLNLKTFSIAAWVKDVADIDQHQAVVTKGAGTTMNFNLIIYRNGDPAYPRKAVIAFSDGSNNYEAASTTDIAGGEGWFFLVGTYDGSVLKIYVNGKEEGSISTTATPATTSESLVVGARDNKGTLENFMDGVIDEVRVYNRALSEGEIKMLFFNRIGAVPSKTI